MTPKRLLAALLAGALLLSGGANAFEIEAMTEAEREAFRGEIRAYLIENPEVLMEAIGVLEAREAAAQAGADAALVDSLRADIFEDGRSWVGGNPDGDVTVVEFLDYRCSYCRRAFSEVESLLERDPDVRLVLKEFPILGEESLLASRFAIAVRNTEGDDAYKAVHDALMTRRAPITEDALAGLAAEMGLDDDAIRSAMDAPEVVAELRANHDLARRLEINGTPSFVIEDEMVRGFVTLAQMQQIVEAARSE